MTSGTTYTPPPAFGRFRLLHQVGAGVLGPVFRTHDAESDRLVAVKVFTLDLTPEQAEALAEEFRRLTLVELASPRLAAPIDAGVEESVPYLAQQYAAGESLDAALRQYGPAPASDAARLISHVADALDAGARVHVFHGALHPRDVLVTPGETHVTGCGVATALERIGARAPVRRPYVAPERESGGLWGAAADVFSLAAIAHEVLTGRRVSPGASDLLPGLDDLKVHDAATLREVLETALDADPERRPGTAAEFAAGFSAALGLAAGAGPTPTPSARPRRRPRAKSVPKLPGLDEPLDSPLPAVVELPPAPASPPPIIVRQPDVSPRAEPPDRPDFPDQPGFADGPPDDAAREAEAAYDADLETALGETVDEAVFDASAPEPYADEDQRHDDSDSGLGDIKFTLTPEPADILRHDLSPDLKALSEELERLDAPRTDPLAGPVQLSADDFPPLDLAPTLPPRPPERRPAARVSAPTADDLRDPGALVSEPPVPRALDPGTASRPPSQPRRVEPYRPLPPKERGLGVPIGLGVVGGLLAGLAIGFWLGSRVAPPPSAAPVPVATTAAPAGQTSGAPAGGTAARPPAAARSGAADRPPATPPPGGPGTPRVEPGLAAPPSAPASAPAARTGGIRVRTTPDKADVYLDGERQGVSPRNLTDLPFGSYTLRVTRPGYVAQERRIEVGPDARNPRASFVLQRSVRRPAASRAPAATPPPAATGGGAARQAPGVGTLSIETRPPGARVRLDNRDVGVSPIVIGDVAAGTHTVRLELSGYKAWATTVTVKAGERLRVSASLERSTTR